MNGVVSIKCFDCGRYVYKLQKCYVCGECHCRFCMVDFYKDGYEGSQICCYKCVILYK